MTDLIEYELTQQIEGPMTHHTALALTGKPNGIHIEYADDKNVIRTFCIAHSQAEEIKRFSDACDRVSRTI